MKKLTYRFHFIQETNDNLNTEETVTPLLFDFQKIT